MQGLFCDLALKIKSRVGQNAKLSVVILTSWGFDYLTDKILRLQVVYMVPLNWTLEKYWLLSQRNIPCVPMEAESAHSSKHFNIILPFNRQEWLLFLFKWLWQLGWFVFIKYKKNMLLLLFQGENLTCNLLISFIAKHAQKSRLKHIWVHLWCSLQSFAIYGFLHASILVMTIVYAELIPLN